MCRILAAPCLFVFFLKMMPALLKKKQKKSILTDMMVSPVVITDGTKLELKYETTSSGLCWDMTGPEGEAYGAVIRDRRHPWQSQ